MKKKTFLPICKIGGSLFSCMLFMLCVTANAQPFNTTYTYRFGSGPSTNTYATDVVASGKGLYWVLGQVDTTYPGGAWSTKRIILKKMDVTGATLFDKVYQYKGDTTANLRADKLVETVDSGFIAVGYYFSDTAKLNPYAAKFDKNGNFVWMYVYSSNNKSNYFSDIQLTRVNIVAVQDMPGEHYIISCAGFADSTSAFSQDSYTNALEIDGNGVLVWNKKYPIASRSGITTLYVQPSALTFEQMNGQSMGYFIAGGSTEAVFGGTGQYLYTFGIDHNGNIIHHYTHYSIPSYVFGTCAIFDNDPSRQDIVVSYTVGNQGIISGTTTASIIGVTKFNPTTYAAVATNFYYMNEQEEYANTIAKTIQDGNYVISTWNSVALAGQINGILKINANTAAPIYWTEYNRGDRDGSVKHFILPMLDKAGTNEFYILASQHSRLAAGLTNNLRVLGTDILGRTCGSLSFTPSSIADAFSPTVFTDTIINYTGSKAIKLDSVSPKVADTICQGNPNYKEGNTTSIATVEIANSISVFPTVLEENNLVHININLQSNHQTTLNVTLFNMTGKEMSTNAFSLNNEANTLQWELPIYAPGNYLLKIISTDGTIQKMVRIVHL